MRQFYENVRVDSETLRFCTTCEVCGKKEYGVKIPFLCRGIKTLARCEKGTANRFAQGAYNRAKANSTQLIAMRFNQCRHCCKWVCDDCYDREDSVGACSTCSTDSRK